MAQTIPQISESEMGYQALEGASGADAISASVQASVQVMDMALSAFEDSARELIASMAAATGIGQNIDITV